MRKYSPEITAARIAAWCDKAERCHWDVRQKLVDWGIPHEERESLITKLIEQNLLNELRYAQAFAHDKSKFNRWGPRKIEQMLKFKGVSDYNIRMGLKEIDGAGTEKAIQDWIRKKEAGLRGLKAYQKKLRMARFLIAKGYDQSVVWPVLEHAFPG